jgi:hypothetical protein
MVAVAIQDLHGRSSTVYKALTLETTGLDILEWIQTVFTTTAKICDFHLYIIPQAKDPSCPTDDELAASTAIRWEPTIMLRSLIARHLPARILPTSMQPDTAQQVLLLKAVHVAMIPGFHEGTQASLPSFPPAPPSPPSSAVWNAAAILANKLQSVTLTPQKQGLTLDELRSGAFDGTLGTPTFSLPASSAAGSTSILRFVYVDSSGKPLYIESKASTGMGEYHNALINNDLTTSVCSSPFPYSDVNIEAMGSKQYSYPILSDKAFNPPFIANRLQPRGPDEHIPFAAMLNDAQTGLFDSFWVRCPLECYPPLIASPSEVLHPTGTGASTSVDMEDMVTESATYGFLHLTYTFYFEE